MDTQVVTTGKSAYGLISDQAKNSLLWDGFFQVRQTKNRMCFWRLRLAGVTG